MVKVTLEFNSCDQAIVALAKLTGPVLKAPQAMQPTVAPVPATPAPVTTPSASVAPAPTRKGRSDKGQARKKKSEATAPALTATGPQTGVAPGYVQHASASPAATEGNGTTDGEKLSPSTTPETEAPAGSTTEAPVSLFDKVSVVEEKQSAPVQKDAGSSPAADPVPKDEQIQAALENMMKVRNVQAVIDLNKSFGVKRWRDIPLEKRSEFLAKALEAK